MGSADSVNASVILSSSPFSPRKKPQQDARSVVSWSGTTQGTRKGDEEREQDNVFASGAQSNSYPRVEAEDTYKLKDWPRKGGRLKSVVDTVRSFRRDKTSAAENTSDASRGAEMKSETEAKNKTRSVSSIRKKFSFLKDRRQRSVSESNLGEMYRSRDDMDPLLTRENGEVATRGRNGGKKLVRQSSENITGSTTLTRQRSTEKYCYSLPNSPTTFMSSRSHSARFVGTRNSRSTASGSTNSHGSSLSHSTHSQEKCPACDFDVLILSECPDCTTSQQEINSNHSIHERLIN